ncbi:precorrin-6A/cobalt-precorrin-6A reductase [Methylogaea oryzae]|uniref:precorrin-6A/cobalt-precorrin-6A reductase n=1 Tax=Methylogaea oryzae TaxID=1295382 RepID=UPI0020CFF31D|nr:precorrin-6A/cobalt-precorrin-6A reductase [Methylogaea oryzae]
MSQFVQAPGAEQCQWFVRLTPDPDLFRRAEEQGIPRKNICAMQGPISRGLNEALWRDWGIDCVITKDSGDVGGFADKAAAAGPGDTVAGGEAAAFRLSLCDGGCGGAVAGAGGSVAAEVGC